MGKLNPSLLGRLVRCLLLVVCVYNPRAAGERLDLNSGVTSHRITRAVPAAVVTSATKSNASPAAAPASPPVVLRVTPNQLAAGGTYSLSLSGTNFQPTMQLDFGPGISLRNTMTVADNHDAKVVVQVAAGTPAGRHLVVARVFQAATVAVLPPLQSQGPGYIDIVAQVATGRVYLSQVAPQQVQQGQHTTLRLQGDGFRTGMALSFGPGIMATGPVQVVSPTQATLPIQVSALAPTMLRHPTLLLAGGQVTVSPKATLTVTAAPISHLTVSPQATLTVTANPISHLKGSLTMPLILEASPSRLFTGQSYTLTLRGMNFVPQMQVDLGVGITQNGGLRIQSPSLATLQVEVSGSAQPGMRWVGLQVPLTLAPIRQDASVLVQHSPIAAVGYAPARGLPITFKVPQEGTIILDSPLYQASVSDVGGTYDVPVINDQTDLTWHEGNAGLADRYEIRFYSKATGHYFPPGSKMGLPVTTYVLVATRSITAEPGYALPHDLVPDTALLAELESKVQSRAGKEINVHTLQGAAAPAIGWDLTWQVVGFHTYTDNDAGSTANASGSGGIHTVGMAYRVQTQEVEVERSKLVALGGQPNDGDPLLDLQDAPTGMTCPVRLSANTLDTLGAVNIDRPTSQQNGATETADHVGDRWQIEGNFDLSNAPWAIETQRSVNTSNPGYPVETETMNNVFVDWGDGTVTPLTIQWHGQYCGKDMAGNPAPCFGSDTESGALFDTQHQSCGKDLDGNPQPCSADQFSLSSATNPQLFLHPYQNIGPYTIRIYELPSQNIQQGGPLPTSLQAGSGGLYGHLLRKEGLSSNAQGTGNLAYTMLCQKLQIQHRTDPVSNGKLLLVAIHITGFPGDTLSGSSHSVVVRLPKKSAALAHSIRPQLRNPLRAGPQISQIPHIAQIPQICSCDVSLVGGASLDYYGQGTVRLTWYQDNQIVGSTDEPVEPSPPRSDAQLAPPPAKPNMGTDIGLHSPALSLAQAQIGTHSLTVSATVVEESHPVGVVLKALDDYASGRSGAIQSLQSMPLQGAPPLGILGPRAAASSGLPPIEWVNQAPVNAPGKGLRLVGSHGIPIGNFQPSPPTSHPPSLVTSAPAPYQITAANPKLPCTFNFPVKGGIFTVGGLQHGGQPTIQHQGNSYSGTGTLQILIADASGTSTQLEQIPIHLQGWTMQPDGVTVASGSFDESPGLSPIHVPGLTASLDEISGTAGDHVDATLTASLANPVIYDAAGQNPPPWRNLKSILSPQGDWYVTNLPIPPLNVYDSGFTLGGGTVTLDLSQTQGQSPGSQCTGNTGKQWMGVLLNNDVSLTAFNLDLPNPPTQPATGWALDSYGFCGQTTFPSGSATIELGTLSWHSISATATQGSFTAEYQDLKVHAPWLNTDFTSAHGTTQLTAGRNAGAGGITLNLDSPSTVTLHEGPVTLTASNLRFASVHGLGWTVESDTTLAFTGSGSQFAGGIVLNGFDYGMDGAGHFEDGSSARHISLSGQKGHLDGALVDLKSVDVQTGPPSSATRLSFAFDTSLSISKTLPTAEAPVNYSISEPSQGQYVGAGPVTVPFKLEKPFPDANPTVDLKMTPTFVGGSTSGGNSSTSGSGVIFSSNLDLSMFGGPPISGQFVLGYVHSDDYWLARAILDLGPTGVPVVPVPPILNLYQVGGGMGYNVTLASFQYSDLSQAVPQDDGTLLFDAHLLIGSPDHTTFGLSGDFVIKPGGQDPGGRMDYHAWLLDPIWTGNSPIYGYFSYSGGVFDGTLNAQLSLLNDQIALNATNDAIHMHIGGGQWYFHLGTQNNPIDGRVFIYTGQAYADIGSDGFMLGLNAKLDLDAGDCNDACAYIHDQWLLNATITPAPLAFSAQTHENFSLGGCVGGQCLNATESTSVAMGLPPPYLDFGYTISMCPPAYINVGLQVLPSLNPSIGGGLCSGINISL